MLACQTFVMIHRVFDDLLTRLAIRADNVVKRKSSPSAFKKQRPPF